MDLAKVEALIEILKESGVAELTLRDESGSITVRKPVTSPAPPPPPAPKSKKAAPKPLDQPDPMPEQADAVAITAPMVGIFHDGGRGIGVGSVVAPGQIVGAIESMKLMNEVVAEVGGTVVEVAVEDGLPVEYGQALFRLGPLEVERSE